MKDEIERIHFIHILNKIFYSTTSKTFTENNFILFSATFSPIGIVKDLIFNILNKDIWSKWLFDELIISLHTFERKNFNQIFQIFYF